MAAVTKTPITVEVDVKLHVDTDTAYGAAKIIEIWLNENPEREIEAEQGFDGKWKLTLWVADNEAD